MLQHILCFDDYYNNRMDSAVLIINDRLTEIPDVKDRTCDPFRTKTYIPTIQVLVYQSLLLTIFFFIFYERPEFFSKKPVLHLKCLFLFNYIGFTVFNQNYFIF